MSFGFIKTKVFLTITTMVFTAMLVGNAFAQSGTSTISGNVTDQTGAAVPGATVTINNAATNYTRSTTTSSDGSFRFPGIPPATYSLSVEAGNFKKAVSSSVQVLVDSGTVLNIALEPGDITAIVNITAASIESIINTQDARLGNNFVPQQITGLPTNLRRVNDLLSLQPGVTKEGYVAGGRSDQANITLDGVDINDQQTGGRSDQFDTSQGSALRATAESVEEFRITTTNANANQGRSSGAQISLVTRGGTNDFRGSVYYFYRPTQFSANSFFLNKSIDPATGKSIPRPSLARDVFGGRIGGPIIKDRAFFFYNYEGQRQELGQTVNRLVPLAHLGAGEIRFQGTGPSCVAGNCAIKLAEMQAIYAQAGINPAALAVLGQAASKYPSNNTDVGDGVNTGGFRFNAPRTISENTHIARLDFNLSDSQQLFFRGNYQWDISSGTSMFPDTPATNLWSHPAGYVIGHNWTISNNMVNNIRFGFTRQAFSNQGDSSDPNVSFRFVYAPRLFTRTLSRVTETYNITDDFTWIKGNHSIQFGGNVRLIQNKRSSLGSAFDAAVTNPSFYDNSGAVVDAQVRNAGYTIAPGNDTLVQNAATALIGRFSQYSGNFTFDLDGNVQPAGTASDRNFKTESYEGYVQDSWRIRRNLTLTFGVRYALSTPVYEKNGFQVVPSTPLGDILEKRIATAKFGVPTNDLVQFVRGGPANNGPDFYPKDTNDWQPRVAIAWSPDFKDGFLHALFGDEGDTTFRGGFGITNDYFGQQLAVSFDGLSTIGFTSSTTVSANTFNVTNNLAPLFTGFTPDVRALPGIPAPVQRFDTPADERQRIETSLDANIQSPIHYTWNASFGRRLPKGIYVEATYIGRRARHLFASRDVMALNNITDPLSGMDWYTAAGLLNTAALAGVPTANIPVIPYFANLFPNMTFGFPNSSQGAYWLAGAVGYDWTFMQLIADDRGVVPNLFFHPQYAAFSAFGTSAKSDYHGGTLSVRQRLGETLTYDFNYTYSKSMDNASGLQTGGSYGSQFILNPIRPQDNYSVSDFDATHSINANFIFQLPVGKGRTFMSDANWLVDSVLGGWGLSGVYRYNSGLPTNLPFQAGRWATNWNLSSTAVRIKPLQLSVNRDNQNAFVDPQATLNSLRAPAPGETGDRNAIRLSMYQTMDLGLSKSFTMPWNENHKFQFRWEVFNVFNHQYFAAGNFSRSSWGIGFDPTTATITPDANGNFEFGKIYSDIQGSPRAMQFGVRFEF